MKHVYITYQNWFVRIITNSK